MLRIAGQTAGPIGLTFFCGHLWMAGGCYREQHIRIKKKKKKFPRATPGPSSCFI